MFQDPALQLSAPAPALPAPSVSFDGINNRDGVLPPDTNGDVGPHHYVQWVNLSYAVYNRTGTLLVGPLRGNQLFSGLGGPCSTQNDGDPIALYDEIADRWLLSPSDPWERVGDVGNVVFPCGAICHDDGRIDVYYGAADTVVCMATAQISDLLDLLLDGGTT